MRLPLLILIILIGACAPTSVTNTISQDNKDVLILSVMIQDYLRKTHGRDINLTDLLKNDTLNRISNNFKTVNQEFKGGHISVYYKFSQPRNSKGIELSDKEKELTRNVRWTEKKLKSQYDGEIQIGYGERFYRLIKIVEGKTD